LEKGVDLPSGGKIHPQGGGKTDHRTSAFPWEIRHIDRIQPSWRIRFERWHWKLSWRKIETAPS